MDRVRYYDSEKYHISYVRVTKTASSSVIEALEAIEVKQPSYKLITVIRNPLDRAWSMYHHCRRANHRQTGAFTDWLNRVITEGYYNNHAAPMSHFIRPHMVFETVYDFDALEILELDYRLELGNYNWGQKTQRKMTYAESRLVFQAFTDDFYLYAKYQSSHI